MKKTIRVIIIVLCILICLCGGGYLVYEHFNREENKDVYEKLQEQVHEEIAAPEPEEVEEPDYIPINFKKLKKTNEDIYAWIQIPDTNIDYPILQHPTDDSYYLNHTIEGRQGYPGAIYTASLNAKDFSDFNTVIYGHNMKDGSMFKHLHKFEDAKFFEKHDTVTIYTETEHKEYKIFAAVVYSDRHLLYGFTTETAEGRLKFLQSLKDTHSMKNQYRDDVKVDENSKIITLSTCIGGRPNNRYLVVAVEMDD